MGDVGVFRQSRIDLIEASTKTVARLGHMRSVLALRGINFLGERLSSNSSR